MRVIYKDTKTMGKELFKITLKRNGNFVVNIDLEKLFKLPYPSFREQIINLKSRLYNMLH